MNINRNNYENYFLLYLDNELSAEERLDVEEFLNANPDLQTEMDMFREVILQPEPDIVFPAKQSLYRTANPVHTGNYEEYFVLYGDNELNATDRAFVEQFVSENPSYRSEFELILSARIEPDMDVVFEDKASLFRHEKPEGLVVSFKWYRAVAAAVVLLFMGGLAWTFIDQNREGIQVAVNQPSRNNATTSDATTSPSVPVQPEESSSVQVALNDKEPVESRAASSQPAIAQQAVIRHSRQSEVEPKENNTTQRNKTITPNVESIVEPQRTKAPEVDERELAANERLNENRKPIIDEAISEAQLRNMAKGKDAATSADIAEPVNNNITYVSNTPGNKKNVLRGFFRKASRVFEKTTNIDPSDNDKNLNIAGFEIALK